MNEGRPVLFQEVVRRRRSVRKFEPGKVVGREVLERIVDCGRWAPSGANVQCWDFIVVDEPTMREAVTAVFLRQPQRLVDRQGLSGGQEDLSRQHGRDHSGTWGSALESLLLQPTIHRIENEFLANNEAIFLVRLVPRFRTSSWV